MSTNLQENADLFTYTKEIVNGKLPVVLEKALIFSKKEETSKRNNS